MTNPLLLIKKNNERIIVMKMLMVVSKVKRFKVTMSRYNPEHTYGTLPW